MLCGIIDGIGPTYVPSTRNDYKYLGLRYAVVPFDLEATRPDYFVSIKQHQSGIDKTPEDAIAGFLKNELPPRLLEKKD
jgi:hypothetical protein